jgi:hypothetical protein
MGMAQGVSVLPISQLPPGYRGVPGTPRPVPGSLQPPAKAAPFAGVQGEEVEDDLDGAIVLEQSQMGGFLERL